MSLAAMLQAHDATALEALANKGLVRRAGRDVDAAEVLSRDDASAEVQVGDVVVTLGRNSPTPQDCPCSATSLCRHILTAILALRASAEAQPATADPVPIRETIAALTAEDLTKLAGADLDKALVLATGAAQIDDAGNTLSVTFAEWDAPVQFLAGRAPREAVFKGPKSRARLAIAAAVIALRSDMGQAFDLEASSEARGALPLSFLEQVDGAIEALLIGVLRGAPNAAMDQVFDLAISARAQAAPRLTGALRNLVALARSQAARDVAATPEVFAVAAARCAALTGALIQAPDNSRLLGVLRRDYAAAPDMSLAMLGAESWRAPSGARGLRVYGFDQSQARWVSAGAARGAGSDLSFSPEAAYNAPLLGTGRAGDLPGQQMKLFAPEMSEDGQLSPSAAGVVGAALTKADLTEINEKNMMLGHRAAHRSTGLSAPFLRDPILLAPQRITALGFDDFAQTYRLAVTDRAGAEVLLDLPAAQRAVAAFLEDPSQPVLALLCRPAAERALGADRTLSLITMVLEGPKGLVFNNITLDRTPAPKRRGRLTKFLRGASKTGQTRRGGGDAIARAAEAAIVYVTDHLSYAGAGGAAPIRDVEALGLTVLAEALRRFEAQPDAAQGLRVIYSADRVLQLG